MCNTKVVFLFQEVPSKQFTNLTINDKTNGSNNSSKSKKTGLSKADVDKKIVSHIVCSPLIRFSSVESLKFESQNNS